MQIKTPARCSLFRSLLKGASVPSFSNTSYSSAERTCFSRNLSGVNLGSTLMFSNCVGRYIFQDSMAMSGSLIDRSFAQIEQGAEDIPAIKAEMLEIKYFRRFNMSLLI